MDKIGHTMARGALWMVLFKLLQRGLGTISTLILARLLVPADFGLVALAMSFIVLLELFGSFGFDMALISHPSAERRHYDTAWTFNVLFSITCAAALVLLAYPTARFYDDPRLEAIIYFLAIAAFVSGFENVGVVAFRKEMQFDKEFKFLIGKKLASFAVTVPLAFLISNYWALVFGIITGRCAEVALSYYAHPYRPRFTLAARHELFNFSKWLVINNMLFFLRERSADFLIGKISGAHALGLFSVAYEISNLPATELVAPINRAVFPGYAKLAGGIDELRRYYLKVVSMIALFVLPMGVGIYLTADLFVPVLLGPKWTETIPVIQVLALYGIIVALQSNNGTVYLALGRPRVITALAGLFVTVLFPLLIWLTLRSGALGAAHAFLIAALLYLSVGYYTIVRNLRMHLGDLVNAMWRPVVAAGVMSLLLYLLMSRRQIPMSVGNQALVLAITTVCGAVSYVIGVLALWQLSGRPVGAEQFVLDRVMPRIPSKLRARLFRKPL